jgi:hypothetical protein
MKQRSYKEIKKELEIKLRKDFGSRCKDHVLGCLRCQVWEVIDKLNAIDYFTDEKNWKPLTKHK